MCLIAASLVHLYQPLLSSGMTVIGLRFTPSLLNCHHKINMDSNSHQSDLHNGFLLNLHKIPLNRLKPEKRTRNQVTNTTTPTTQIPTHHPLPSTYPQAAGLLFEQTPSLLTTLPRNKNLGKFPFAQTPPGTSATHFGTPQQLPTTHFPPLPQSPFELQFASESHQLS